MTVGLQVAASSNTTASATVITVTASCHVLCPVHSVALVPCSQREFCCNRHKLGFLVQSIHRWKVHLVGYNSVAVNTGLSSFV